MTLMRMTWPIDTRRLGGSGNGGGNGSGWAADITTATGAFGSRHGSERASVHQGDGPAGDEYDGPPDNGYDGPPEAYGDCPFDVGYPDGGVGPCTDEPMWDEGPVCAGPPCGA